MYSGINASTSRRSMRRAPPRRLPQPVSINSGAPAVPPENSTTKERVINFCRILYHCIRRVVFGESDGYDGDFEDFDVKIIHYKPSNLDDLCQATFYSREEIKLIYRGFKQECPAGVVDEEQFKDLYSQFYPLGDAGPYAHHVFTTFDQDEDGHVTFDQFITGMSVLARGSMAQKLRWVFNLYDLTGKGTIRREDMLEILTATHQMVGFHARPPMNELMTSGHVDRMFNKMDSNGDGVISFPEFFDFCQTNPEIRKSMEMFDTALS